MLVFVGVTLSVPGLKLSGRSTGSEFTDEGRHKT